jgi:hypothetical protein
MTSESPCIYIQGVHKVLLYIVNHVDYKNGPGAI